MKRAIIICIWAIFLGHHAGAQEQLTKKQRADRLFERYEYFKSVNLYLSLLDEKPDIRTIERIAECYRMMNQYREAEKWYARVVASPKADPLFSYHYAEILLNNQKFEPAKEQFKRYFLQARDKEVLALKLASCDSAALWTRQPPGYVVENVQELNSMYSDWGLSYFGKSALIFTSDRKTGDSGKDRDIYNWTGNGWLKLFLTDLKGEMVTDFERVGTGNSIFNSDYHIGPIALNAAEDIAYITVTTTDSKSRLTVDKNQRSQQRLYTRRLELMMATKKDGQWGNFISFPYNNVNKYSVGHAALSKEGDLIYFTSDMPGGEGKTDIWYCQKLANGIWGEPVNCGKIINTKGEEAFPTISENGQLYFSSKGLSGMGGYDIFSTTGKETLWTKPVNLKYPINTTSDDFWLTTKDGLSGYLSSNREGGKGGDDIYSFKPLQATPSKSMIPDTVKVSLKPMEPGKTFVLKDIYYDLDKSDIRADAAVELDKLFVILQKNPALKIELSSHTDSRASDAYNLALSRRRALSAVNYLIMNGIAKDRLLAEGYGELRLLNRCANGVECSEQEHQLNRRTEIRVIDGGF